MNGVKCEDVSDFEYAELEIKAVGSYADRVEWRKQMSYLLASQHAIDIIDTIKTLEPVVFGDKE